MCCCNHRGVQRYSVFILLNKNKKTLSSKDKTSIQQTSQPNLSYKTAWAEMFSYKIPSNINMIFITKIGT